MPGFNPRARVGRDLRPVVLSTSPGRFNPRARVGRDAPAVVFFLGWLVSIHAPAWGATRPSGRERDRFRVSIHAPAWGATLKFFAMIQAPCCFNPRARVGRDKQHIERNDELAGFNPRARVGRDLARSPSGMALFLFQSTRPRGARPGAYNALPNKRKLMQRREPRRQSHAGNIDQGVNTKNNIRNNALSDCESPRKIPAT